MTAIDTAAEVQAAESVKSPALLGPWALMWRQFRRHKVAWVSLYIVGFIYFVALFGEFLAPANYLDTNTRAPFAPPQGIHFFTEGEDGGRDFQLHARGLKMEIDREAMRRHFVEDPSKVIPLGFFVEGYEYKLLWLIPTNRHFFGPTDPGQRVYFFGADRLGRDILSRIIMGTRISMSIGLVGVAVSLVVGVSLGGISGYYGGWIDNAIQRLIEFLRSIPTIPLWMGLAAAMPSGWSPLQTYFAITLILSFLGWTELARVVRGRFLALNGEDYVAAARYDGCSHLRVILRHMVPAFTSHIITAASLAVPAMILAETALSFLGLGLQAPVISWGVLLQEAQNIRTLATAPWLLLPGAAIVIAVLAMNFIGDGLRDAADPYAK